MVFSRNALGVRKRGKENVWLWREGRIIFSRNTLGVRFGVGQCPTVPLHCTIAGATGVVVLTISVVFLRPRCCSGLSLPIFLAAVAIVWSSFSCRYRCHRYYCR